MMGRIDAAPPGLQTALDAGAVRDRLRAAAPELRDRPDLDDARIVDVRYRPGSPCWVLYRFGRHFVSARLLGADESPTSPPEALAARYAAAGAGLLPAPILHLPEVPMALYAFPIDAALPGLFDALDPAAMKAHLNRLWGGQRLRVRKITTRLLGYTPEARAAVRYEVLLESKETGLPEVRRLIGKMHAKKPAARRFADAWVVWRAAGGAIGLAAPVGYVASVGVTLQEQVAGERLGGLVTERRLAEWLRKTAGMLARLHGLRVPLATRRRPADEAQSVHRWAGVLAAIRPDLAARVERLRDRLAGEIDARARLSGPIHADFHHTNVLVDRGRITLIDLDEMAYGDPMVDVGRFLASLRIPALRAFGSLSGLEWAGRAFLEAYRRLAPADEGRVRLFEAASLLVAAASSFRIQRPAGEEEVVGLLEEAERVADIGYVGTTGRGRSPDPAAHAAPDARQWATDGVYLAAALAPEVRTGYGADIGSCRVTTGGDSGRLRYELRGWCGGEKWRATLEGALRVGGGGAALVRRLEAVRAALDGHPDAPTLPRPVAYLRSISLFVFEAGEGVPLTSLLADSTRAAEVKRVGRALAQLHGTPVSLDAARPLDEELGALRRRVERLGDAGAALLTEIERRMGDAPAELAPVVRARYPHDVLLGERVAISRADDVALAHPWLDLGGLLAGVALWAFRHGRLEAARAAADRIAEGYGARAPAFEAAMLLWLACGRAKRNAEDDAVRYLVERAEALFR